MCKRRGHLRREGEPGAMVSELPVGGRRGQGGPS